MEWMVNYKIAGSDLELKLDGYFIENAVKMIYEKPCIPNLCKLIFLMASDMHQEK
jgi:hypothetical protein